MKIEHKRILKLATILLSSLFIASVSASVYYTMFMNATVGVAANKVQFWAGSDFATAGGSISDARQKVTFSSMDGLNGSVTTITDPVRINNTDSSNGYTIELKLDSWTGDTETDLYYVNVTMYDGSTKKGDTIYLVPGGSGQVSTTGQQTIAAGANWRVQWDIYWKGSATASDSVTVNLKLEVTS
ncbi:MAG: hypothetical protein QHH24_07310 [Candidatus Bathyarchaeota archaeon]|nr:hypothetical protein [Candidatus Bathyarchaeota archaeon]